MKTLFLLIFTLVLLSCEEKSKEIYETEIVDYTISHKEEINCYRVYNYYIYFQSATSTERAKVSYDTYHKYNVGDKISVLIKYWQKPKKK
jgi:hypothetical protein